MHPQLVEAVAVGGIVDYITLPTAEYRGKRLHYPLGISDIEQIGNNEFNLIELRKVKFFWFDGEDDKNTTFDKRYNVWSEEDIDVIFELFANKKYDNKKLYDKNILKSNLKILRENGINFRYKTYPKIKHDFTDKMKSDVMDFFTSIVDQDLK